MTSLCFEHIGEFMTLNLKDLIIPFLFLFFYKLTPRLLKLNTLTHDWIQLTTLGGIVFFNNTLRGGTTNFKSCHHVVSQARKVQEQDPTDANVENHNKARAEFTRHKLQQTRTAWHEKNASLRMEKHLTQKRATHCFVQMYQEESTVKLPQRKKQSMCILSLKHELTDNNILW